MLYIALTFSNETYAMKRALFLLLFFGITIHSYSQAPVVLDELQKEGKLYIKEGKPFTGPCYLKHDNGKIAIKGQLKNGLKDGSWIYWYSDGQKKRETTYIDGKKEGITYYWYENGQKQKEIMFRQDKNIDQKLWDEEGNRLPNPSFVSTTD